MFSEKYGIFIDNLEKKIELLKAQEDGINLIRGDLRNLIEDIFKMLGQHVDFRKLENRLNDLQEIDIDAIAKAVALFDKAEFKEAKVVTDNGAEVLFQQAFDNLLECLQRVKDDGVKGGFLNNLFRLEMIGNSAFQSMISILGQKAPLAALKKMVEDKLAILKEGDLKILWSYIKEEFGSQPYKFEYDKEILGEAFFNFKNINELRRKIAEYIVVFRPTIAAKIWKRNAGVPIFSFGIARVLAITQHYTEELSLDEITMLKIVNRIAEFGSRVLFTNKNALYECLGISPEGRIASLKPEDLDKNIQIGQFAFKNDEQNCKFILFDLRQLVKISDYNIAYQTDIGKALFNYKLKYEIFSKENSDKYAKKAPSELFLQKELCAYLLDKDIYSYGKSFGSYEIDLITEPIPPSYVIETKIYKNIRELETIERCVTKDFIQLTEYLDKEPGSPPYGILVIYNFTDVLIKGPRHWIQKRIWILPINISQITPSRRSKSIAIEESDTKNLIRCILLDAQPKKSR